MATDVEFNPETETYRTVHDVSTGVPLSTTIVLAVEQVVDDVNEVLHDTVDPDALDAIFRPCSDVAPSRHGVVEFVFADCQITVRSDGVVDIDPDVYDDSDRS